MKFAAKKLGNLSQFVSAASVIASLRFAPIYRTQLKSFFRTSRQIAQDYNDMLTEEKKAVGFVNGKDNSDDAKVAVLKFAEDYSATQIDIDFEPLTIKVGKDRQEEIEDGLSPMNEVLLEDFITIDWPEQKVAA